MILMTRMIRPQDTLAATHGRRDQEADPDLGENIVEDPKDARKEGPGIVGKAPENPALLSQLHPRIMTVKLTHDYTIGL